MFASFREQAIDCRNKLLLILCVSLALLRVILCVASQHFFETPSGIFFVLHFVLMRDLNVFFWKLSLKEVQNFSFFFVFCFLLATSLVGSQNVNT